MALINIDLSQVSGNLKTVFENYNVSSYKLKRLYKFKHYKVIIKFLASAIYRRDTKEKFDKVIPALEAITERDFLLLCKLYHTGDLDAFLSLVRLAAGEINWHS
jgi:hypothetical protein